MSYNPSYDDHQNLLRKAVRKEEKRLDNIDKIEDKTTRMFPTIDEAPTTQTWLEEMSEGLPNSQKTVDDAESVQTQVLILNFRIT